MHFCLFWPIPFYWPISVNITCHWETRRQDHSFAVLWTELSNRCAVTNDWQTWKKDHEAIWYLHKDVWTTELLWSLDLPKSLTGNTPWWLKVEAWCWGTGVLLVDCGNQMCAYQSAWSEDCLVGDYLHGNWSHKEWWQEPSRDEACDLVDQVSRWREGTSSGTSGQADTQRWRAIYPDV